jgi:hypothetical protein
MAVRDTVVTSQGTLTAVDRGPCYYGTCCRQANGIRQQQPCFLLCSSLSQILGLKPLRDFVVFRSFYGKHCNNASNYARFRFLLPFSVLSNSLFITR